MTDFTPAPNALAAAHRASVLAEIARRRALLVSVRSVRAGRALLAVANLMDGVARSLQTDRPRDPNGIPADAWLALGDAEGAAAGMGTGFPDWFGLYVTQAINGRALEAPAPIDADSPALVKREAPLIAALRLIHVQLVAPRAPEVAEAMLEAAFVLHAKLAQFAEEHSTRLVTERPTES